MKTIALAVAQLGPCVRCLRGSGGASSQQAYPCGHDPEPE